MTPKQIELARHALGLPNVRNRSYRNAFVAGEDHEDYWDWYAMTKSNDAVMRGRTDVFGGQDCFYLTYQGAVTALKGTERLDVEDFPLAIPRVMTA